MEVCTAWKGSGDESRYFMAFWARGMCVAIVEAGVRGGIVERAWARPALLRLCPPLANVVTRAENSQEEGWETLMEEW